MYVIFYDTPGAGLTVSINWYRVSLSNEIVNQIKTRVLSYLLCHNNNFILRIYNLSYRPLLKRDPCKIAWACDIWSSTSDLLDIVIDIDWSYAKTKSSCKWITLFHVATLRLLMLMLIGFLSFTFISVCIGSLINTKNGKYDSYLFHNFLIYFKICVIIE